MNTGFRWPRLPIASRRGLRLEPLKRCAAKYGESPEVRRESIKAGAESPQKPSSRAWGATREASGEGAGPKDEHREKPGPPIAVGWGERSKKARPKGCAATLVAGVGAILHTSGHFLLGISAGGGHLYATGGRTLRDPH